MPKHTVEVVGTQPDRYRNNSTDGTIIVRPPIKFTSIFNLCVMGDCDDGVLLEEAFSTSEETVLFAKSARSYDEASRVADINTIADRIGILLEHPETAKTMMHEQVFESLER